MTWRVRVLTPACVALSALTVVISPVVIHLHHHHDHRVGVHAHFHVGDHEHDHHGSHHHPTSGVSEHDHHPPEPRAPEHEEDRRQVVTTFGLSLGFPVLQVVNIGVTVPARIAREVWADIPRTLPTTARNASPRGPPSKVVV